MIRLYSITLFLALLTLTNTAFAAKLYKVEMIIFSNLSITATDEENWLNVEPVPVYDNTKHYSLLSPKQMHLGGVKNSLRQSAGYKILFHGGWIQPVYNTRHPRPMKIRGGNILDNGMYELDGYIAIGRGLSYLHFRPELYLSRQTNGFISTEITDSTQSQEQSINDSPPQYIPPIPEIITSKLNQPRRMRSNELHYIDHPLGGILVKMTPIR